MSIGAPIRKKSYTPSRLAVRPLVESLESRTHLDAVPIQIGAPVLIWPTPIYDGQFHSNTDIYGTSLDTRVEHAKTFTKAVASFHDPNPGDPSVYIASIDWGNNTISQGTITPNGAGDFDITGSYTFAWGAHSISIAVTRTDEPDWNLKFNATVIAVPPAFAGKSFIINATAGQYFSGVVATYVGIDTNYLERYTPSVGWGGGTWDDSQATLVNMGDGTVNVVAHHVFLKPGVFDTTITVLQAASAIGTPDPDPIGPGPVPLRGATGDAAPAYGYPYYPYPSLGGATIEAHGRAKVAPAIADGNLISVVPRMFSPFTGAIARFTTAASADDISHWNVVVQLPGKAGPRSIPATFVPERPGSLLVQLSATFISNWNDVSVYVYDDRRPQGDDLIGIARGSVQASAPFYVKPDAYWTILNVLSGTAGQESSGTLCSIYFAAAPPGTDKLVARINWGDGSYSDGQLVPNSSGGYDVIGTHTYAPAHVYQDQAIYINVSETFSATELGLPPGDYAYASTGYARIRLAPSIFEGFDLGPPPWYPYFSAGSTDSGRFGVITAGDATMNASSFAGSIAWEGGTVSNVTVSQGGMPRLFDVYATNPFASAGFYKGVLTMTSGQVTKTLDVSMSIAQPPPPPPQPLGYINGRNLTAIERQPFTGTIGYFYPTDASIPAGDYKVSVYWPDGSGDALLVPAGDGSYLIQATHTFPDPVPTPSYPNYSISIVHDDRGAYGTGSVTVQFDPTRIHAQSIDTLNFRQREKFTAKVATFRAPQTLTGATPAQFTATIDWGDGTTSAGVITAGYDGLFEVSGTKAYEIDGSQNITVTIDGPGGPAVARSYIFLKHDPVIVEPTDPTFDNLTISGLLGRFTDEDAPKFDPVFLHSNYAALVDWGDGKIAGASIDLNNLGSCDITSSHTYLTPGEYIIEVLVRRNERGYFVNQDQGGIKAGLPTTYNSADGAAAPLNRSFKIRFKVRVGANAGIIARLDPTDDGLGPAPAIQPVATIGKAPPLAIRTLSAAPRAQFNTKKPIKAAKSRKAKGAKSSSAAAQALLKSIRQLRKKPGLFARLLKQSAASAKSRPAGHGK